MGPFETFFFSRNRLVFHGRRHPFYQLRIGAALFLFLLLLLLLKSSVSFSERLLHLDPSRQPWNVFSRD